MVLKNPRNSRIRSSRLVWAGAMTCVMAACSQMNDSVDSQPLWLASPGMSQAEVDGALNATFAVRMNLKTNRATLFMKGVPLQQWNIASADVTGQYHGGQPKYTPEGIYGVEDIEHCPVWRPRDPVNPVTGRVAQSEDERWRIFNSQPEVYGPCGSRNPLGRYVFWFQGPFGMHGNSAEDILHLADPEDRRVSGGCLRNPNAKIKEIFHLALDRFAELGEFKRRVLAMEQSTNKFTLVQSVRALDMRVVVGSWRSDPLVNQPTDSAPPQLPTPVLTPTPTPIPEPVGPAMICNAVDVDTTSKVASVHRTLPATQENISAYYRLHDPVRVLGLIPQTEFYRTGRGYIHKRYIGRCANL